MSTYRWTPQGQKLGLSGHRAYPWIDTPGPYRLQVRWNIRSKPFIENLYSPQNGRKEI